MDEFFELGSPHCLLCTGECDPDTHERYNAMVERENALQMAENPKLRGEPT